MFFWKQVQGCEIPSLPPWPGSVYKSINLPCYMFVLVPGFPVREGVGVQRFYKHVWFYSFLLEDESSD